ncbi:hypothetical protein [Streptomyces wuyuanensis]|uniref:hypothetical protein n=1 Tax=Streptomyces wuyuanensis TaxID=1196353 RepID=UPI0038002B5A
MSDTPSIGSFALPHAESPEASWSHKALDLVKEGLLHGQARHAPHRVVVTHVWGHCPRCKHRIDVLQTHQPGTAVRDAVEGGRGVPRSGVSGRPDGTEVFTVAVACSCPPNGHPGAPPKGGCGASFRVQVPFMNQEGS